MIPLRAPACADGRPDPTAQASAPPQLLPAPAVQP